MRDPFFGNTDLSEGRKVELHALFMGYQYIVPQRRECFTRSERGILRMQMLVNVLIIYCFGNFSDNRGIGQTLSAREFALPLGFTFSLFRFRAP